MKEERQKKRMLRVLAAVYLAALVWIILFKMALSPEQLPRLRNVNLIPFGDALVVNGKADYGEVFQNLLIFVPFGVYLQMLFPQAGFLEEGGAGSRSQSDSGNSAVHSGSGRQRHYGPAGKHPGRHCRCGRISSAGKAAGEKNWNSGDGYWRPSQQ